MVKGNKAEKAKSGNDEEKADKPKQFLYQGIAERNFERKFQLGDFVKVIDAKMEHGLLHIELQREIPEALKPRKIAINTSGQLLDGTRTN